MSTFRKDYRELTDHEKATIESIKAKAEDLLFTMQFGVPKETESNTQQGSRELSLAVTNLEQAIMWAVKHWTA